MSSHRPRRLSSARPKERQQRFADAVTRFAGSMTFIYIHVAWFAAWIAVNEGLFGSRFVFDDFPFGLLTMIVSLEAIFLSTLVMISQNRTEQRDAVREEDDFRADVRSEAWLQGIGAALGIDRDEVENTARRLMDEADGEAPSSP